MTHEVLAVSRSYRNNPRRRFSRAYKREVVQTLLASCESMARVARDHELNHNQLSRWRKEYEQGLLEDGGVQASPQLVPVVVSGNPVAASAPTRPGRCAQPEQMLELRLAKGTIVMRGSLTASLLRSVIEAMQ